MATFQQGRVQVATDTDEYAATVPELSPEHVVPNGQALLVVVENDTVKVYTLAANDPGIPALAVTPAGEWPES